MRLGDYEKTEISCSIALMAMLVVGIILAINAELGNISDWVVVVSLPVTFFSMIAFVRFIIRIVERAANWDSWDIDEGRR